MIDSIDKINWDEMPETAVGFKFEDDDFYFAWVDKSGYEYHVGVSIGWGKAESDDNRPIYKVSDHHPDMQRKQWNGEGLPPIGWKGEGSKQGVWVEGQVVYHSSAGNALFVDDSELFAFWSKQFRPIRSERDAWIEKAKMSFDKTNGISIKCAIEHIYDEIKTGRLESP